MQYKNKSYKMTGGLKEWVQNIDIWKDSKKDWAQLHILKDKLYKDLEYFWGQVKSGKRKKEEFDRYANECKRILEKNWTEIQLINAKYQAERKKIFSSTDESILKLSEKLDYYHSKAKNILTEAEITIKEQFVEKDHVRWFNRERWNYIVSVEDFEKELRSKKIEDINWLALKNYLNHLRKKWTLNENILLQKLWNKEKLLDLSIIWWLKFEKEVHVRNWLASKDILYRIWSDLRWFKLEWKVENIFKETIKAEVYANLPKKWINEKLQKEWDSGLLSNKYEKIIDEFEKEFRWKKITWEDVRKYFYERIKSSKISIENKKDKINNLKKKLWIKKEKKIWDILNKVNIQTWLTKDILNTKLSKLKDRKIYDIIVNELNKHKTNSKEPKNEIIFNLIELLKTNADICTESEATKKIEIIVSSPIFLETAANSINNSRGPESLKKTVDIELKIYETEKMLSTKIDILKKLWYSWDINELKKDKKKVKLYLSKLIEKQVNKEASKEDIEVARILREHINLQNEQKDDYIANKLNLSEKQLEELKKKGLIDYNTSIFEDLEQEKKENIKKQVADKPKDRIHSWTEINIKTISIDFEKWNSEKFWRTLDKLKDWSSVEAKIWKESYKIKKEFDWFNIISKWKNEKVGSSIEVLTNLDTKKFIDQIWANFLMKWDYNNIFWIITEKNIGKCQAKFNKNEFLTKSQKEVIIKTLWKMLLSEKEFTSIYAELDTSTLEKKFETRKTDTKTSLYSLAIGKWYLNNWTFLEETFKSNILEL